MRSSFRSLRIRRIVPSSESITYMELWAMQASDSCIRAITANALCRNRLEEKRPLLYINPNSGVPLILRHALSSPHRYRYAGSSSNDGMQ